MLVFKRVLCAGRGRGFALLLILMTLFGLPNRGTTQELHYPQQIRIRYEAIDSKAGGHFIIWLERDRLWHGLDPRLYPAVKYVKVTHLTPAPGSPLITMIELGPINSANPEFYHAAGIVR